MAFVNGQVLTADELNTLAVTSDIENGVTDLGFNLGLTGSVLRTLKEQQTETLSVMSFGAKGDGVTDDSLAFQRAMMAAHLLGGGRVFVPTPAVEYRLTYPVFFFDNTELFGTGPGCRVVMENPTSATRGRGNFVIGSSVEVNRDKAIAAYEAGTYPDASIYDATFVNPPIGSFLKDNQSYVQSSNCSIHDLYLVAKYTGSTLNGGYAVIMNNAQHCHAYNIWGEGWTQLIGMGSDVTPETPSNYECHAWDLFCQIPNQDKTYYSIGFIANSSYCSIKRARQAVPMVAGTQNGSGIATNAVEYCDISDIYIPDLGRTVSSEGVLLQNARGCRVNNIHIGNAINAVATYYTLAAFNDSTKPNVISGVSAFGCDHAISLRAKYAIIDDVKPLNCTYDLYFGNLNASNNTIRARMENIGFNTDQFPLLYFQNNTVTGWRLRYKYVRPSEMLFIGDTANYTTIDTNQTLTTKASPNLRLLYPIPSYMRGIVEARCFMTFNTNALSGPSGSGSPTGTPATCTGTLRRLVAFDGNTGTAPYTEVTNVRTATLDTVQDTTLVVQASGTTPGYIPLRGSANGMDDALDFLVTFFPNGVAGHNMKAWRFQYLGD